MCTQGKHSMQTRWTQIRILFVMLFITTKTGQQNGSMNNDILSVKYILKEVKSLEESQKTESWTLVLLLTDDGTLHRSLVPLWSMLSPVFSWLTPSPPSGLCANSTWAHYLHNQHPHPLTLLHQEAEWFKGWVRRLWADLVQTPSLPNTVCMTLGKLFKLSVTQFPPL